MNCFSAMQGISQALSTQKLANIFPYTDEFRKNIRGKAPADLAKSYPEHEHARKVGKFTSKVGGLLIYPLKPQMFVPFGADMMTGLLSLIETLHWKIIRM